MGDDDPEIKRYVKVNAKQLVNDVPENVEKRVSNCCDIVSGTWSFLDLNSVQMAE